MPTGGGFGVCSGQVRDRADRVAFLPGRARPRGKRRRDAGAAMPSLCYRHARSHPRANSAGARGFIEIEKSRGVGGVSSDLLDRRR